MLFSGLIGRNILASRSPWLHEEEARAQGLDLSYRLFDFTAEGWDDSALPGLLKRLIDEGFCGFNVTYPFKQQIMGLLDELTQSAQVAGAVNTVAIRDGRLIGHNTDMPGFRDSLLAGLPGASLARVLQLGAGGAGSAVAGAMLSAGAGRVEILDVDPDRSAALTARLAKVYGEDRVCARAPKDFATDNVDGIVNATPMGMAANPASPIDPALIGAHHWVADIVYFPLETTFLAQARAKGCATLNGSGMVIAQAALAFEIITGHRADKDRMRASFVKARDSGAAA